MQSVLGGEHAFLSKEAISFQMAPLHEINRPQNSLSERHRQAQINYNKNYNKVQLVQMSFFFIAIDIESSLNSGSGSKSKRVGKELQYSETAEPCRDVFCKNCDAKLGWMYEFATEDNQR